MMTDIRDYATIWVLRSPNPAGDHLSVGAENARDQIALSVREHGISRFGWSVGEASNLKKTKAELEEEFGRTLTKNEMQCRERLERFKRDMQAKDWIVHLNVPFEGRCLAVLVADKPKEELYNFDDGIMTRWGRDFRHCIYVKSSIVLEFQRPDWKKLDNFIRREPDWNAACFEVQSQEFLKYLHDAEKSLGRIQEDFGD